VFCVLALYTRSRYMLDLRTSIADSGRNPGEASRVSITPRGVSQSHVTPESWSKGKRRGLPSATHEVRRSAAARRALAAPPGMHYRMHQRLKIRDPGYFLNIVRLGFENEKVT